jgi:hypothetical protein
VSVTGALIYGNLYYWQTSKELQVFPEPVANKLRRALHFTNVSFMPQKALEYYKEAHQIAMHQCGMHPLSEELIGLRIQVSALFQKAQAWAQAIDVLETIKTDCLNWIELYGDKDPATRTRVLGKTVGISVKLGELYAHDRINDPEKAEESLLYAVNTVLTEKKRRETEGVKEGEGDWMTNEEIGGSLEGRCRSIVSKFYTDTLYPHSTRKYVRRKEQALPRSTSISTSLISHAEDDVPFHRPNE